MSFPAYPDYQDSGVDWLGEVPSHWRLRKIKHVATFAGGSTPSRDDPSFWNGDIPWVSPKDMKSETIIGSEERITERGLSQMAGGLIGPGAVLLVVRSGILRHTVPVAITGVPVALNQDMKALRFNPDECAPSFFFRWVQGLNDSLTLAWMKQGATVESLEHQFLAETILPLPPIAEQASISIFLDRETAKIDALIEEQRRLIALLKEKRQAVISHAVTKGLDPHAPMKDSGSRWLGDVPTHWATVPLMRLTAPGRDIMYGIVLPGPDVGAGGVPIVKGGDVKPHRLRLDLLNRTTAEIEAPFARARLRSNDIVYSIRGSIGDAEPVPRDLEGANITQDVARVSPRDDINGRWLLYVMKSKPIFVQLEQRSLGAAVRGINIFDLKRACVPVPPRDEQAMIARYLDTETQRIDELAGAAETGISLLRERRAALISAAVTGKIDVRGSAKVLPFPIDRSRARALIATEIIERSAHQATFGRVKFQKIAFLAEAHVGISELAGSYTREAAGPLDRALIEEMESGARSIAGIEHEQPGGAGTTVSYRLEKQRGAHRQELAQWLGADRTAKLDKLIGDFAALSTKEAEAVATLYGVWNDALNEGASPSDDDIISGFLNDWHPEKRAKFRASELPEWLGWMRRHGIVPTGSGPKTTTGRLFI